MTGVDCATRLTEKTAKGIADAGYEFVGRYLVPLRGNLRWKALTRAEARIISDAGLQILTVYETTADRAKGGKVYGTIDGASARECADAIGLPKDAVIYFAVDYQTKEYDVVEQYLRGVKQFLGPYKMGVYGSYYVVEAMRSRGVTNYLWQCVAWSYRMVSPHYSVYQHTAGASVAGVAVDINDCPDMDRAGLWAYGEDEEEMQRYNSVGEMPGYAQADIKELCNRGILKGRGTAKDGNGYPADLDLSEDMIRNLILCKRMIEGETK